MPQPPRNPTIEIRKLQKLQVTAEAVAFQDLVKICLRQPHQPLADLPELDGLVVISHLLGHLAD